MQRNEFCRQLTSARTLRRHLVVWSLIVLVFNACVQADDEKTPTATSISTAVIRFQDRTEAPNKGTGDKVSELLSVHLTTVPELLMVEREDLDRILKEHELNLSGAVAADEAIRVGRLTGARLIVTGSVMDIGNERYLVAKVISTETSRVLGASAKGKIGEDLGDLIEKLSEKIATTVREKGTTILPAEESHDDRLARVKKALGNRPRPSVMVKVTESHTGLPKIDPAAQTELTLWCRELGFTVIDPAIGRESDAEFLITGEGLSEFAARYGNLVSVRARLEVKLVNRKSGEVVAIDRQMVRVIDSTEVIAGKEALQQAAATIAERLLPKTNPEPAPAQKKKK